MSDPGVNDGRFAVIGSNSFSGAAFVAHLLAEGHQVLGISRSVEPHAAFLPYRWADAKAFRFVQADLNHDLPKLMAALEEFGASHVVNFSAQSMVAESWRNPDHWFMTNVVSTVRLHDSLRDLKTMQRYVHVSTPEVFGSTSGDVKEDAPFNPSTPYAVSRAAAEMSLRTYHAAYGFPVLYTRAANVFGAGQQLYRIVPRTVLFARTGRKLQLHGGGHSVRSFIAIEDVSAATLAIALRGTVGHAYHISTPRLISIRDLVSLILARMGVAFEAAVEVVGERLGKDAAYRLDSTKLRTELGWADQVTLEEGIDRTIAWVDRNLAALAAQPLDYIHKP
jgi:dTDP-glucose 4,6-dehydratase